jgi:DNA phosphorothioation-dependent restriction protein DptG
MKKELQELLDKHVSNIESRLKLIPKSRKHKGMLAEIQNKLDDAIVFSEKAESIMNEELEIMLHEVNTKYVEALEQEEADAFVEQAQNRLGSVLQNGISKALS